MESLTYLKNLKITPKKLRLFLPVIKKMTPEQAVQSLMYSPEKSARVFYKGIQSAIANARQTLKVGDDLLKFKLLTVEEGQKLRRFKAGGRGTAKPIMRRYAHIKIILVAETATGKKSAVRRDSAQVIETPVTVEKNVQPATKTVAKKIKQTDTLPVKKSQAKAK